MNRGKRVFGTAAMAVSMLTATAWAPEKAPADIVPCGISPERPRAESVPGLLALAGLECAAIPASSLPKPNAELTFPQDDIYVSNTRRCVGIFSLDESTTPGSVVVRLKLAGPDSRVVKGEEGPDDIPLFHGGDYPPLSREIPTLEQDGTVRPVTVEVLEVMKNSLEFACEYYEHFAANFES